MKPKVKETGFQVAAVGSVGATATIIGLLAEASGVGIDTKSVFDELCVISSIMMAGGGSYRFAQKRIKGKAIPTNPIEADTRNGEYYG